MLLIKRKTEYKYRGLYVKVDKPQRLFNVLSVEVCLCFSAIDFNVFGHVQE